LLIKNNKRCLILKYLILLLLFSCTSNNKIDNYWNTQRKGSNYFNSIPTEKWFQEAKNNNITLVRMTYDKWESKERDFLIGNADEYKKLIKEDLDFLVSQLDLAHKYEIKIILVPLTLPCARWSQNNNSQIDGRIWKSFIYQEQAIEFWRDLARELKNHPAIVGYNIINEPFPEKFYGKQTHWIGDFTEWYASVKNTPGDINLFYEKVITAIRSVDSKTTIILDSGLYATPWAMEYLEKQQDNNVLYSFHMYEPYDYTTKRINNNRFSYPGTVYINDIKKEHTMNKEYLYNFLSRIDVWREESNIPSNRILVGEFGVSREVKGAELYMKDLITLFNDKDFHWLFYAFQEDDWHAWDYQFGEKQIPYQYWEIVESGKLEEKREYLYDLVKETYIWDILQEELSSEIK